MLKENFSHVYDKFKLLLYDKAFNDDGDDDALSAFEVICMEIITALKEPTVNAFADAAHMSSPNATYRVNSLIKKGYINKKRGETDRREYYLEATEKYTKNYGMVYDYIGIVIGCAIIFYLVRLYGAAFVQSVVSKHTYDKYIGWLDKGNRFDRFFIFMMIWPISPADFLCMLAALTKMSFKRYMTIIILTKPFTLVVYTYGLTYIIDFFWQML